MMDESRSFLLEFKLFSSFSLYEFINSIYAETISTLSVFSSDPLFSCAIALCTLIFLYLPHFLWRIVFSPVLILTWILLLSILRLGAIQNPNHEQEEDRGSCSDEAVANDDQENRASNGEKQSSTNAIEIKPNEAESMEQVQKWVSSQMGFESSSCFVDWNVKSPLEVIYEEGEEEEEENRNVGVIQRDPSLSRYYPESDSDSSSSVCRFPVTGEWDSPGSIDDEEEREGLIEILLDGCKKKKKKKEKEREMEFEFEEDNLIEIDISGEISCH